MSHFETCRYARKWDRTLTLLPSFPLSPCICLVLSDNKDKDKDHAVIAATKNDGKFTAC